MQWPWPWTLGHEILRNTERSASKSFLLTNIYDWFMWIELWLQNCIFGSFMILTYDLGDEIFTIIRKSPGKPLQLQTVHTLCLLLDVGTFFNIYQAVVSSFMLNLSGSSFIRTNDLTSEGEWNSNHAFSSFVRTELNFIGMDGRVDWQNDFSLSSSCWGLLIKLSCENKVQ